MKEIWKDIIGYEGLYQVSNLGNIKSLGNNKSKKEKLLKNYLSGTYYMIDLNKNGLSKKFLVHQLVAIVFLNHIPCKHKLVVNHINFNRLDNRVENLEVITQRENTNKKHLKSSSKYTGVSWHKKDKKWQSMIVINKKLKYLGSFICETKASFAYEKELNKNNFL
jgi:hypothetical protein